MIELIAEHNRDGYLRIRLVDGELSIQGKFHKNIGEALNSFCIELMEYEGIDLHEHNFAITHEQV